MTRDRAKPAIPAPISEEIWRAKYRLASPGGSSPSTAEADVGETFARVAEAAASVEKGGKRSRRRWAETFYDAMADFGFLPGGRILAGAGSGRSVTLFNCFVMGRIEDDLGSIFENVKEAALTMQQGGGIGHDFSTLRPKGALVKSIGADASGPVSFMDVWNSMCRTIMSAGARRGAMMGTLRVDHPDILEFIAAKSDPTRLRNFNLSVLVTDAFMAAVAADAPWDLVFAGKTYRTIAARDLWDRIMRAAYNYAEPGVIFIDRINAKNNLAFCEEIAATNPCGEQPLPPYGACLLGSINLTRFVDRPFEQDAAFDLERIRARVRIAVRLLDNIIDVSNFPLDAQHQEALAKRRIGLGITGLADALVMLGLPYGSPEARSRAAACMAAIDEEAYLASAELAAEKGAFPLANRKKLLASPHIQALPEGARRAIRRHGLRNGCLTSIAPTGTISLFAGNVSSGIEPIFAATTTRRILGRDDQVSEHEIEDYAVAAFRALKGERAALPDAFVTARDLTPADHLAMQAALQPHVDSAISKTINCPEGITYDAFASIYRDAYDLGLKGCTAFRPNKVTGSILEETPTPAAPTQERKMLRPADTSGGIVYMAPPLERDAILAGETFKIDGPGKGETLFVTINDIERDGRRRPYEIFINGAAPEHHAWAQALARLVSAIFRRGGDTTFVAQELKAILDPEAASPSPMAPSLLAAIGGAIEQHMRRLGASTPSSEALPLRMPLAAAAHVSTASDFATPTARGETTITEPTSPISAGANVTCPRCSEPSYHREAGCWICRNCGLSRCE